MFLSNFLAQRNTCTKESVKFFMNTVPEGWKNELCRQAWNFYIRCCRDQSVGDATCLSIDADDNENHVDVDDNDDNDDHVDVDTSEETYF